MNLVFKVADDKGWHILDLKDLRSMLKHVSDHASEYRTQYGNVSAASIGAIQRQLGIVLGTGDMSELALGWCTFGVGDHMAHYGVNAGVPKTLIQHLIRWVAAEGLFSEEVSQTLLAVLATEISPELVPASQGQSIQSTQARIGPYALQDFTLWHVLRQGARPSRIAYLAERAWADASTGGWPTGIPEEEKVS